MEGLHRRTWRQVRVDRCVGFGVEKNFMYLECHRKGLPTDKALLYKLSGQAVPMCRREVAGGVQC